MTTPTTHDLTPLDRARLQLAARRYDLWLDLEMVRGRDRRALRRELLANLHDAARRLGTTRALASAGDLRAMAREAARDGTLRSRWVVGGMAMLAVAVLSFVAFAFASLAFADGVLATDAVTTVSGQVFPFVGSEVVVQPAGSDGAGLAVSMSSGPGPLVLALLAGVVGARPWLALRGRSTTDEVVTS